MTLHMPKGSKFELLNSTSPTALFVGENVNKFNDLEIPKNIKLNDKQLSAIEAGISQHRETGGMMEWAA